MKSQKKSSLKICTKCSAQLTNENWLNYLKSKSAYICIKCFREYGKTHYKIDLKYGEKQKARYHSRRSAVIHFYGDVCKFCFEDNYYKLTIDNINNKKISTSTFNYLYNNLIDKNEYQVLCYNCSCSKNTNYKDKYALRDKKIVIENYGNKCNECGEDKIERLTISHENNNRYTGVKMYRWLIKNNLPNDFNVQAICFNCYYNKKAELKNYNLVGINPTNASVLAESTSELESTSRRPKLL